jgi:phosphoserine aminotransferase
LYYPSTLTIKGKRVKLGDDISELGLVIIDTTSSAGIYTIDYADKETYTASFTIEVNPNTKKITEIYYILF